MPKRHYGRRNLIAAAASVSAAVLTATALLPIVSAQAAAGCSVTYLANSWPGGFTAGITIRNLGDPIDGWTLAFAFPDSSQRVVTGWGATWTQSGADVSATNAAYNGQLPTGASTSIGFQGAWTTANPDPGSFTLNQTACTGSVLPSPSPSPSYELICDIEDSPLPDPCPIEGPSICPITEPSPSPTLEPPAGRDSVRLVALNLPPDPPKPCKIKVQQVVVVSEVFKAEKKPKVGDTLEIEVDINATTAAKNAAQKAIDVILGRGKALATVTVLCTVTNIDDHDALLVTCQVTMIYATARGVNVGMNVNNGPKIVLGITLY